MQSGKVVLQCVAGLFTRWEPRQCRIQDQSCGIAVHCRIFRPEAMLAFGRQSSSRCRETVPSLSHGGSVESEQNKQLWRGSPNPLPHLGFHPLRTGSCKLLAERSHKEPPADWNKGGSRPGSNSIHSWLQAQILNQVHLSCLKS